MSIIVIGNAISLVGAGIMTLIGFIKNKNKILAAQCVQFVVFASANFLLGGITGVISNGVSLVRNIFCFKKWMNTPIKLGFIAIQIVLSVFANKLGFIGWLPIIAGCVFTWFIDLENDVLFKIFIIAGQIMWAIYDFYLKNFTACFFDVLCVFTNIIGIVRIKKATVDL